ncbi:MAG TPA: hypothetical protein ENI58_01710 [Nitrospirae bacterium]|nr:hypothetical protein [Nitrospirota bacterium]
MRKYKPWEKEERMLADGNRFAVVLDNIELDPGIKTGLQVSGPASSIPSRGQVKAPGGTRLLQALFIK